jgi:hypothetical protein
MPGAPVEFGAAARRRSDRGCSGGCACIVPPSPGDSFVRTDELQVNYSGNFEAGLYGPA